MIWVVRNWYIFETVTYTNTKNLINIKETDRVFVGNIDCNMSAALIAVKRNLLSAVGLNRTSESYSSFLRATSTYGDM